MRLKSKLVHGVGRNDADYSVYVTAVIDGKLKKLWICPFYRAWKGMIERCYSVKYQAKKPTYMHCTAAQEWHSLSAFREWMITQDHEGKQLDKDILFPGNKVYSPETCVFVTRNLNMFMTDSGASRGKYPIGTYWYKNSGKFKADCHNPFSGNREHLGYFDCPNQAHEAWRSRKHEHACRYADMQTDPRIAQALRTRYAINNTGETK